MTSERGKRVAVDQGPVEVEERPDVRAFRPGLDGGDQILL